MSNPQMPKRDPSLPGIAVVGALVTGGAGLLLAFGAMQELDYTGAGLMLLAAAVAFGSVTNALFRS